MEFSARRFISWLAAVVFLIGLTWSLTSDRVSPVLSGLVVAGFVLSLLFFTDGDY